MGSFPSARRIFHHEMRNLSSRAYLKYIVFIAYIVLLVHDPYTHAHTSQAALPATLYPSLPWPS